MHIWKIDDLKEDIKSGAYTEKDGFVYFLVCMTLGLVGIEATRYLPVESLNIWDYVRSMGTIIVVLIGTIFVFRANGGSKGSAFLGRFFGVAFVVGIRFLVIFLLLGIGFGINFVLTSSGDEQLVTTPMQTITFLLCLFAMFWRICRHMEDINSQ